MLIKVELHVFAVRTLSPWPWLQEVRLMSIAQEPHLLMMLNIHLPYIIVEVET